MRGVKIKNVMQSGAVRHKTWTEKRPHAQTRARTGDPCFDSVVIAWQSPSLLKHPTKTLKSPNKDAPRRAETAQQCRTTSSRRRRACPRTRRRDEVRDTSTTSPTRFHAQSSACRCTPARATCATPRLARIHLDSQKHAHPPRRSPTRSAAAPAQ